MHGGHRDNLAYGLDGAPRGNCGSDRVQYIVALRGSKGGRPLTPSGVEDLCAGSIGGGTKLTDESLVRQDIPVDIDLQSQGVSRWSKEGKNVGERATCLIPIGGSRKSRSTTVQADDLERLERLPGGQVVELGLERNVFLLVSVLFVFDLFFDVDISSHESRRRVGEGNFGRHGDRR
jgi:hypothetical protein